MSNIIYNEEQEAFELPYKIWDIPLTVRFYAETEEDITDNIKNIAMQLETINGGRKKLAKMITDEGLYEGASKTLEKTLVIEDIYVDIDDEEIVAVLSLSSDDGYMKTISAEVYGCEFEIVDNSF